MAPPKRFPVDIQTSEDQELLDEARKTVDRQKAGTLVPKGAENKLKESIGEYGARRYVQQTFKKRIKTEVLVPRRGQIGPQILDRVFDLDSGEIVVIEAKQGQSKLGSVNEKVIQLSDTAPTATKAISKRSALRSLFRRDPTTGKIAKAVEQFSPQWFQDRIQEIRKVNKRLANKLERAWYDGKIIARVIYVDDDGLVKKVEDRTEEWNRFKERGIPAEPTRSPEIERNKSKPRPKNDEVPAFSVKSADPPHASKPPVIKAVEDIESPKPPVVKAAETIESPKPPAVKAVENIESSKPPVVKAGKSIEAPKRPAIKAVESVEAPKAPVHVDLPESPSKPSNGFVKGLKEGLDNPKVKMGLKVGGSILLDIGISLAIGYFEGEAIKDGLKKIEPQLKEGGQQALDKALESGEIVKFRTGVELETGYQMYYKFGLNFVTRCHDSFFGYDRFFERFELLSVQVTRESGRNKIPETGNPCNQGEDYAVVYMPIFQNGESITDGASNAADKNVRYIYKMLDETFVPDARWQQYLASFYRYTQVFPDSSAAMIWREALQRVVFRKLLVGVGMKSPWDLFEEGIRFEEIVETVPWLELRMQKFLGEFLDWAETWASDEQKALWKQYYDKRASFERGRKCETNSPNERSTKTQFLSNSGLKDRFGV